MLTSTGLVATRHQYQPYDQRWLRSCREPRAGFARKSLGNWRTCVDLSSCCPLRTRGGTVSKAQAKGLRAQIAGDIMTSLGIGEQLLVGGQQELRRDCAVEIAQWRPVRHRESRKLISSASGSGSAGMM